MKRIILENKLAFGAGLAIVVLLVAVSYADNLSKLGNVPPSSPLAALAQEISSAYSNNIITNKGIANSLASKVMDAQNALNKNKTKAAVEGLNAFIKEANAQTVQATRTTQQAKDDKNAKSDDRKENDNGGKHITAAESAKLASLANAAITQIQNPVPVVCNGETMLNGTCCASPNRVANATNTSITVNDQRCLAA